LASGSLANPKRSSDVAQVVDAVVGGLCTCASFSAICSILRNGRNATIRSLDKKAQGEYSLRLLLAAQSPEQRSIAPATLTSGHPANEYMQELPESVQQMVGTVYAMLTSTATEQQAG